MSQKILLISPPFVQMNTPYPATVFLKGFLNTINVVSNQADLGIEVILELFSKKGFTLLFKTIEESALELSENGQRILLLKGEYLKTVDNVIAFLQNSNPTIAHRICGRNFLPESNRFAQVNDLDWAFGSIGTHDKARHLATLYLEDISDLIIETVDPHFGFSRYAERLSESASTFDELHSALYEPNTFIDNILIQLLSQKIEIHQPTVVGLSVPFPGNLYSAFKCGQWLKTYHPNIKIVMGGGYPNTELRTIKDKRVFAFVDFITLDDGEAPLQHLIEYLNGQREIDSLKRTFLLSDNKLIYCNGSVDRDKAQKDTGTPDYSDLPLKKYISVIETVNSMHRLWSDGRWNKLTLAHGCYWGRCTFCDVSLDYIQRFEPNTSKLLCDKIEQIIMQTGESGFHFVDEAAPPALLKSLALEIIRRGLNITWWTNIRFEKNFTKDLCLLLRESGCIAISGGLEVASDRLLSLINKGVNVAQVTRVANYFTKSGIMVHAYLMYGFPTQTEQETIDSLEIVRQMFQAGVINSGFWHHFAMTAHSPVGLNPEKFNVKRVDYSVGTFANNELQFIDNVGASHAKFGEGLRKSLYNYMHENAFEFTLNKWFKFKVPKTSIAENYINNIVRDKQLLQPSPGSRLVWLGGLPVCSFFTKSKKGKIYENAQLLFNLKQKIIKLTFTREEGVWIVGLFKKISISENNHILFEELEKDFEEKIGEDFLLFWNNKNMQKLRDIGLLCL